MNLLISITLSLIGLCALVRGFVLLAELALYFWLRRKFNLHAEKNQWGRTVLTYRK